MPRRTEWPGQTFLILLLERLAAGHLVEGHSGFRANHIVGCNTGEVGQVANTDAITGQNFRAHAELLRLLRGRSSRRVHATVRDRVQVLTLVLR
jgi:hypothetical protein